MNDTESVFRMFGCSQLWRRGLCKRVRLGGERY